VIAGCGGFVGLWAAGSAASADERLPAQVLNLSRWRLTLPVDTDRPGRPDEIPSAELAAFQHPQFFFVRPDDGGVVFRAPCGGATTKGSSYPRSELRELQADGRTRAAWSTADPTSHTLAIRVAVIELPPAKPHVVFAQIHDADDDLLLCRVEGTKLLIEREGHKDVVIDRAYQLGTPFNFQLTAGQGRVQAWKDGRLALDWEVRRDSCYFKTGCYTQSNTERGDAADAAAAVVLHRLSLDPPEADRE